MQAALIAIPKALNSNGLFKADLCVNRGPGMNSVSVHVDRAKFSSRNKLLTESNFNVEFHEV